MSNFLNRLHKESTQTRREMTFVPLKNRGTLPKLIQGWQYWQKKKKRLLSWSFNGEHKKSALVLHGD